jgi:hypothetical protein
VAAEARGPGERVRQRRVPFAPTPRLALLVLAVAPAWLLSGWPAGRAVAAGLLALVALAAVVDAARAPRPADVDVARELPPTAGMGDPVPGRYAVRSRLARPLVARVVDRLPPEVGRDGPAELPARVPPDGEAVVQVTFAARARGEHLLGPVAVRRDGAARARARTVRFAPATRSRWRPRRPAVRRFRLLALQHRLRDAGCGSCAGAAAARR